MNDYLSRAVEVAELVMAEDITVEIEARQSGAFVTACWHGWDSKPDDYLTITCSPTKPPFAYSRYFNYPMADGLHEDFEGHMAEQREAWHARGFPGELVELTPEQAAGMLVWQYRDCEERGTTLPA